MKYIAVISILALLLTTFSFASPRQSSRCATGHVRGFAHVRGDPRLAGVGAIPGIWAGDQRYFGIRYNCTAKGVWARRVDQGIYDIMFPGNIATVAQVSPANQQGATASVDMIENFFRVIIRGPDMENGILQRRDQPFYITIF